MVIPLLKLIECPHPRYAIGEQIGAKPVHRSPFRSRTFFFPFLHSNYASTSSACDRTFVFFSLAAADLKSYASPDPSGRRTRFEKSGLYPPAAVQVQKLARPI